MSELQLKKKKTKTTIIVGGLFLSFLLISSSLFFLLYPFPSDEKVAFTTKQHPIIFNNGEIFSEEAIIENNTVYLPISFVQEHIDSSIILDEASSSIIVTTKEKVIQFPSDSLSYFINEESINLEVPAFVSNVGKFYVSLEPLSSIYPYKITYHDKSGLVQINKHGETYLTGIVNPEKNQDLLRLRIDPMLTSPYVSSITPGEDVKIESEKNNYYFVRKENGVAGYVKKDVITLGNVSTVNVVTEKEVTPKFDIKWPINLTWEAVYSKNPTTAKLPEMPGLNVVSPTWFKLKNNEGDISNLASIDYVNWAKARSYHVWGLFSNDFDTEKTHEAFKDFSTRKKMIRQLLQYSQMYQLDGINIDIENVNVADGPLITQFMREATPYFHQAGLVVSMDITFISNSPTWSMFYERKELGEIVDYMVVMAYDEHWGSSPVSGSVASLPWVKGNLEKLLEIIPNEKLILGVPLYSRIWEEKTLEDGTVEVSSKAYGMDTINNWIKERNLTPTIDAATGQNFVVYEDQENNTKYKIWLEDEHSLKQRTQLVHQYQLAGVATWARVFGNNHAWNTIDHSLKNVEVVKK
ncbi:peptidoglycan hydrolase [Bacillus timonensis]|nr:peptidoglycan hydrolase [Bacillus timonensis]